MHTDFTGENISEYLDDPEKEVRCRFLNENVSGWENETAPAVEYENMILYKLHVRGYTKLARKMVSHKELSLA